MGKEDKLLLFKDLCARVPYKVIIKSLGENKIIKLYDLKDIDNLPLPYLRSMSSMTLDELIEFNNIPNIRKYQIIKGDPHWDIANYEQINWLLKHHFDFIGLIEKGLAIEVTEDNNLYKD